jgi:SWI/SNF-related matrix-associated actin-dependent regulator 1 of chromatin subfamily A
MIRRLKKDVLPQLPAKIQQIVLLPDDGNIKNVKREKLEFAALMKEPNLALAISNLSELRQENALKKIKFAKEYIDNILEQKAKVVVFAWHKVVIDELKEVLKSYDPLIITGATAGDKRQAIVEEFQTGSGRVIVGNIKAMGTGLTLHAASDVVFLEMDWTPGMNTQAEDRIHRIGQAETCHIHYLVYADSVDAFIAKKVVKKKDVIEKILDKKGDER